MLRTAVALSLFFAVALAMYDIESRHGPPAPFIEHDFILLSAAALAPLLRGRVK